MYFSVSEQLKQEIDTDKKADFLIFIGKNLQFQRTDTDKKRKIPKFIGVFGYVFLLKNLRTRPNKQKRLSQDETASLM